MSESGQVRTYPSGVPSWIDIEQPDPGAAEDFYGGLFGWSFTRISAEGAAPYLVARLGGRDVAGIATAETAPATWNTYIAVDDAGAGAERVSASGGEVVSGPADVGDAGRMVICRDPEGAVFRLWQAGRHPGAQVVNEAGSWNFSDLHTDRPEAVGFYAELFGWSIEDLGFATMVRRPGYGDHLEATVDPGIRARQEGIVAPPRFEDAIGWVAALEPGSNPHWHVTFAVADRDATVAAAPALGAEVLASEDTLWTRTGLIRDPQGAIFTASQFTPPA
jgi:uncharacterized protein